MVLASFVQVTPSSIQVLFTGILMGGSVCAATERRRQPVAVHALYRSGQEED